MKVFIIADHYQILLYLYSVTPSWRVTDFLLPDFIYLFSAGFKRPVVIFGPISDAVNEKLANDMPDDFVIASKWSFSPLSHAAKDKKAMFHLVCGNVKNNLYVVALQYFIVVTLMVCYTTRLF